MTPRVHLAGRGAVSCFGQGHKELLEGVFAGRSGVLALRRLRSVDCLTTVAAEVPEAVVRSAGGEALLPAAMAIAAAREALGEARLDTPAAAGLVLATTKADLSGIVGQGQGLGSPGRLLDALARELRLSGPRAAVSAACASGLTGLALAGRWLRAGHAEHALVVGVDALSAFVLRGFSALLALDPGPCRPFDRSRAGLSLGEGAAAIVLSKSPRDSLGIELAGWGETNDAHHLTSPRPDGAGLARAIALALRSAGASAADVDYVHLHGTGTAHNDAMECAALATALPAARVASGTKAQTGHTLGAAGVLETLIAAASLRRGEAPGNAGLAALDAGVAAPLARTAVRLGRARIAVKVAAGFGGINAAVVLRQ